MRIWLIVGVIVWFCLVIIGFVISPPGGGNNDPGGFLEAHRRNAK